MADEITQEAAAGADKNGAIVVVPAKQRRSQKTIAIGAAIAVLLLGGGGGAYYMLAGAPAAAATEEHAAEDEEGRAPFDVPAIMVNLNTADGAPHFLKVHVMLVPGPKATEETLKAKLPLLLDAYQPFLREIYLSNMFYRP